MNPTVGGAEGEMLRAQWKVGREGRVPVLRLARRGVQHPELGCATESRTAFWGAVSTTSGQFLPLQGECHSSFQRPAQVCPF